MQKVFTPWIVLIPKSHLVKQTNVLKNLNIFVNNAICITNNRKYHQIPTQNKSKQTNKNINQNYMNTINVEREEKVVQFPQFEEMDEYDLDYDVVLEAKSEEEQERKLDKWLKKKIYAEPEEDFEEEDNLCDERITKYSFGVCCVNQDGLQQQPIQWSGTKKLYPNLQKRLSKRGIHFLAKEMAKTNRALVERSTKKISRDEKFSM